MKSTRRYPGTHAAIDLPSLADCLRREATLDFRERHFDVAPGILRLAADALDEVAAGRDARKLIATGKALIRARCVEAIIGAAAEFPQESHKATWRKAREIAAERLHVDLRSVQRHWKAHLRAFGKVEDDLLPPPPIARTPKKRAT